MAKVTLQTIADQVGVSRMTVSNAFSRPDAPVVPEEPVRVRRPRLERQRAGLAGALHRTADRVAPPACGTAS